MAPSPSETSRRPPDSPWWLFVLVAVAVFTPLWRITYCTLYTEGEVMQGLFTVLLWATGVLACGLAFIRRTPAIAMVALLGGLLLFWQAGEARKWTMIHEDVTAFVRYARETRAGGGAYPASVNSFTFAHPGTRAHIQGYEVGTNGGYRLTYFMDDPGITYWYDSETGFGYYPD